jgi:hypothetical protein
VKIGQDAKISVCTSDVGLDIKAGNTGTFQKEIRQGKNTPPILGVEKYLLQQAAQQNSSGR